MTTTAVKITFILAIVSMGAFAQKAPPINAAPPPGTKAVSVISPDQKADYMEKQRDLANLSAKYQALRSNMETEFQLRPDVAEVQAQARTLSQQIAGIRMPMQKSCEAEGKDFDDLKVRCIPKAAPEAAAPATPTPAPASSK